MEVKRVMAVIKITPDELNNMALKLSKISSACQENYQDIQSIIVELKGVWQGEEMNSITKMLDEDLNQCEKLISDLNMASEVLLNTVESLEKLDLNMTDNLLK